MGWVRTALPRTGRDQEPRPRGKGRSGERDFWSLLLVGVEGAGGRGASTRGNRPAAALAEGGVYPFRSLHPVLEDEGGRFGLAS